MHVYVSTTVLANDIPYTYTYTYTYDLYTSVQLAVIRNSERASVYICFLKKSLYQVFSI